MLQQRGTLWVIPPDPKMPWSINDDCAINDDIALDFKNQDGGVPNSPRQFYKLHVVFTQFYVWLKNNKASHPYPSWTLCVSLSWGFSVNTYTWVTIYMQSVPSSSLKSRERLIWKLPPFQIPCKASDSSISRVLPPPDLLEKYQVFLDK